MLLAGGRPSGSRAGRGEAEARLKSRKRPTLPTKRPFPSRLTHAALHSPVPLPNPIPTPQFRPAAAGRPAAGAAFRKPGARPGRRGGQGRRLPRLSSMALPRGARGRRSPRVPRAARSPGASAAASSSRSFFLWGRRRSPSGSST